MKFLEVEANCLNIYDFDQICKVILGEKSGLQQLQEEDREEDREEKKHMYKWVACRVLLQHRSSKKLHLFEEAYKELAQE